MIASLVLSVLPALDVHATLVPEPARVQIGAPVTWTLTVDAPDGAELEIPKIEPGINGSWVVLASPTIVRTPDPAGARAASVRLTWRAFALEPGAPPPLLEIAWKEGTERKTAKLEAASIEIASSLAVNEDAARPPKGFRPAPDWTPPGNRWLALAAAGIVVLVALLVVRSLRRRRRKSAPRPATPLERLRAIEERLRAAREADDESQGSRAAVYALTQLVRAAIDSRRSEQHAALTDTDWMLAVQTDERVPEGVRSASTRLFAAAERIKYAAEVPTRFALDEHFADARALLEALADAQPIENAPRKEAA